MRERKAASVAEVKGPDQVLIMRGGEEMIAFVEGREVRVRVRVRAVKRLYERDM